jgi:hypothetical protein
MCWVLLTAVVPLCYASESAAQSTSALKAVLQTVATDVRNVATVDNGVIAGVGVGVAAALVSQEREVVRLATLADGMDDAFNAAKPIGSGSFQLGGAVALAIAALLRLPPDVDPRRAPLDRHRGGVHSPQAVRTD